jgi:uncharacterized protein YggU (UPF0235/DUF167 family)
VSSRDFRFHDGESGTALAVRLVRKKGKTAITKIKKDGTVVLNCGSEMGDLDSGVINYFSGLLGVKPEKINVIAGQKRSEKLLSFIDIAPTTVQKKIIQSISGKS